MSHHYFASHGLGWAVAETREEAVTKAIRSCSSVIKGALLNAHKAGEPGWYVWSTRVELPVTAAYTINFFQPVKVPQSNPRQHFVTYISKREIAFTNNVYINQDEATEDRKSA